MAAVGFSPTSLALQLRKRAVSQRMWAEGRKVKETDSPLQPSEEMQPY